MQQMFGGPFMNPGFVPGQAAGQGHNFVDPTLHNQPPHILTPTYSQAHAGPVVGPLHGASLDGVPVSQLKEADSWTMPPDLQFLPMLPMDQNGKMPLDLP
jgi:hypothetical protein